ncbi:metal ABC transporter ATP-binding protein [Myxococcota bacterium]|nr:metal ABC transporter ATP-binding protein [Myxococcota bacterium]
MSSTPLLRCERLVVGYGGRPVLPPVDLEIRPGEFWVVVGRNGSGKTTWFRTLLGLLSPVSGQVAWPQGRRPIAYVPQRSAFDELYPVPVREVVAMGAERGWSFLSPGGGRGDRVRQALTEVGAWELRDRNFRALSEGQKQRVLLARMLCSQAGIALLDEPTAAMDAVAEEEAMAMLDGLRRAHNLALVVVSHHLQVAFRHADRILFLDPEVGVEVGTVAEIQQSEAWRARYQDRHAGVLP